MKINLMSAMPAEDVTHIILHTACHGVPDDDGKPPPLYNTTFKNIDRWHTAKWKTGFGYHGLVDINGKFYKGRPLNKDGAHTTSQGMNQKSLGLCMSGHGNYHHWTDAQYEKAIEIVYKWCIKFKIPFHNVLGHRETGAKKSCPGNLINMNKFREDLQLYANTFKESKKLSPLAKRYAHLAFRILYAKVVWNQLPNNIQFLINDLRDQAIFKNIKE